MPTHVADIPKPKYAYVNDEFLTGVAGGWTQCVIYGLSALPGRAWGLSAMMDNGAIFQHLPVQAFSLFDHQPNEGPSHSHDLSDLQVWSCYGQDFSVIEYSVLSEMAVRVYLGDGTWEVGRYWFTAAPYNDFFSETPDQHKHFNFVWLNCGGLASLPGNRLLFNDPSFTTKLPEWGSRPAYRVNTRYWFPEDSESKFDSTITEHTA
jgi:hypothetical protein